jgi:hypothetical protein
MGVRRSPHLVALADLDGVCLWLYYRACVLIDEAKVAVCILAVEMFGLERRVVTISVSMTLDDQHV